MRNENAFNAWLSKELRSLHSKGFHHAKISDKFTAGVSDFLIWGLGKSVVIESKYVKEFPKDTSDLLEHTFFVFRDVASDGAVAVVYRRKNGGYGLISDATE